MYKKHSKNQVIGCNNSTTPPRETPAPGSLGPSGVIEALPPRSGANELGGRTYYELNAEMVFPTAGTYENKGDRNTDIPGTREREP
jgi:hypothetical protein